MGNRLLKLGAMLGSVGIISLYSVVYKVGDTVKSIWQNDLLRYEIFGYFLIILTLLWIMFFAWYSIQRQFHGNT